MIQYLKILQQIGLNTNQAKTYLAGLELGRATVIQLSRKTGIIRTTIYDNLRVLKDYGLISETIENDKRFFMAEPPTKLTNILQNKKQQIEENLPGLLEIFNSSKIKPKIQFFYGIKGIIKIMELSNIDNPEKKNLIMGNLKTEFSWLTKEERLPYKKERIKKAIRNYTISTNSLDEIKKFSDNDAQRHQRDLREIRLAPGGLDIPFVFYCFHNKVAIFSSIKEGYSIVIESPEFTQGFKSLFNFVWGLSSEIKIN